MISKSIFFKFLFLILFCLSSFFFIENIYKANSDLTVGRFALHMDEQVSYDGIDAILKAEKPIEFLESVIGPDMRYGRLVWILPAPFVKMAEQAFGEPTKIFTNRMFHAVILTVSYILAVLLIGGLSVWSLLALNILFTLPYTPYYTSMPKPEPLLLLFILLSALSFFKFKNKKLVWFFWGGAFGLKFSFLPSMLCLIFLEIAETHQNNQFNKSYIKSSISFFLFGFLINVPALLLGRFKDYAFWVKTNAFHGSNNASINSLSWFNAIGIEYFYSSKLALVFAILLLFVIFLILKDQLKDNLDYGYLVKLYNKPYFWFLLIGITQIIPIILTVQRLWLYYLHVGFVFLVLFLLSKIVTEQLGIVNEKFKKNLMRLLFLILVFNSFLMKERTNKQFKELSERTINPFYITQIKKRNWIIGVLKDLEFRNKPVRIAFDPELFQLENSEYKIIDRFWGPFNDWLKGYDLIITKKNKPQEPDAESPLPTSAEYNQILEARASHQRHVVNTMNGKCFEEPCYFLFAESYEVRIYLKVINK